MKNLALDVESIALALSEEGGYEYYHIDDDLKELAKNVSDMQAENEKLRERIDAAHMSRLLTENENESLRELVRDLWEACPVDGYYCIYHCEHYDKESESHCKLEDRMAELGIEVDR